MSAMRDLMLFRRAKAIISDEMCERVWLMRQLGASFETIAQSVGRSTMTVRKQYWRRFDAVKNYDALEINALRASHEAL